MLFYKALSCLLPLLAVVSAQDTTVAIPSIPGVSTVATTTEAVVAQPVVTIEAPVVATETVQTVQTTAAVPATTVAVPTTTVAAPTTTVAAPTTTVIQPSTGGLVIPTTPVVPLTAAATVPPTAAATEPLNLLPLLDFTLVLAPNGTAKFPDLGLGAYLKARMNQIGILGLSEIELDLTKYMRGSYSATYSGVANFTDRTVDMDQINLYLGKPVETPQAVVAPEPQAQVTGGLFASVAEPVVIAAVPEPVDVNNPFQMITAETLHEVQIKILNDVRTIQLFWDSNNGVIGDNLKIMKLEIGPQEEQIVYGPPKFIPWYNEPWFIICFVAGFLVLLFIFNAITDRA